jgi:predicted DNA-binding transcriptional regulator YafY
MSPFQNDVASLMADTHGRLGKTRRPLFRIYEIHSAIRSDSYPNCSKLAELLCVQRKTIQRDITFMRDELNLPVKYEESLHGYFYE